MRAKLLMVGRGVLAVGAFFVLTGANGEGCGGPGDDGQGGGGTSPPCPPGTHSELVCNECDGACHEECVPDEVCPDGSVLEYVCQPVEPTPCVDGDPSCLIGGECFPICVPIDPCGPDAHEEWVCGPVPLEQDGMDPGMPPPEECYPICVPNDPCGPGYHEEWICAQEAGGMEDPGAASEPGGCFPVCVPDPICGPGYHEEVICNGGDDGSTSSVAAGGGEDPGMQIPPDECIVTCVPDSQCGPGYHEEVICEPDPNDPMGGGVCYVTCIPDDPTCPDGTLPVTICVEDGMGGIFCWEECQDPAQPQE